MEGNLCFEVPAEGKDLTLIYSPGGYLAESWHYLRLDPLRTGSLEDLTRSLVGPPAEREKSPKGMSVHNPVEAGGVVTGADGAEVVVTAIVDDAYELINAESPNTVEPSGGRLQVLPAQSGAGQCCWNGLFNTNWLLFPPGG